MLSISHTLTGAFIATKLPYPLVYVPLALAAHYLEDWIPHWDVGTGLSKGRRKRSTALILGVADLVVALVLVYFLFQANSEEINYHAWVGAFAALLPDFMEAPRNFLKWDPPFIKPLNRFHHWFHNSTPNIMVGLTPQFVTVAIIYLLS